MSVVVVIGGGPAGLMAACQSALKMNKIILLEKNEKLGKKLYITGKGRCNLSNDSSLEDFLKNVVSNPKFMYASLANFSVEKTKDFFESNGLKLKTERGNRIFPESDKASDVTKVFTKLLSEYNVDVKLNTLALEVLVKDGRIYGVKTEFEEIKCDYVIIATGGISYPLTGSTGDGYKIAKSFNHNVIDPRPALVGIELNDSFCKEMQGLSLKNVKLVCTNKSKTLFSEMGEMLFAHYGVSGPIVLSCSSYINRLNLSELSLYIDLKPALDESTLTKRLINEFKINNAKSILNTMPSLLPKSMCEPFLRLADVKNYKTCSEITVLERNRIISTLKKFPLSIKKLRPIDEAIVTSGGISVKDINPKTMESKLVKGLFFAGEVIDVDALTGGFNIQIALSTGYLAGINT